MGPDFIVHAQAGFLNYWRSKMKVRKSAILLIILCFLSACLGGQLVFEKNGIIKLAFDANGSIISATTIAPNTENPPASSGNLTFENISGQMVASLSSETSPTLSLQGSITTVNAYSPLSLQLEYPIDNPVRALSTNGDLESIGGTLQSEVVYFDDMSVAEWQSQTQEWSSYVNIVGTEKEGRYDIGSTTATTRFYIKDHLGSTRAVITSDPLIVETIWYQAYGGMQTIPISSEDYSTREKFIGKEFDREGEGNGIALSYLGARYYDPQLGLFISKDPNKEFFNPYQYTTNPIGNSDVSGKQENVFEANYYSGNYLYQLQYNYTPFYSAPGKAGLDISVLNDYLSNKNMNAGPFYPGAWDPFKAATDVTYVKSSDILAPEMIAWGSFGRYKNYYWGWSVRQKDGSYITGTEKVTPWTEAGRYTENTISGIATGAMVIGIYAPDVFVGGVGLIRGGVRVIELARVGAEMEAGALKSANIVEQYALRANESGFYPVMVRGFKEPQFTNWLEKGEVWKFGTTKNPTTRYPLSYLNSIGDYGVNYVTEFSGTLEEAVTVQNMKILNIKSQTGFLPPGNKIVH
jgi:RHS repeat-associated protein